MHTQGNQLVPEVLLKLSDTNNKDILSMCMKKCHAKNIFGKMTAYQAKPFCMAFVFLIVVFFIDHYCVGGI